MTLLSLRCILAGSLLLAGSCSSDRQAVVLEPAPVVPADLTPAREQPIAVPANPEPVRDLAVYQGTEKPRQFRIPGYDAVGRFRRYIVAIRSSATSSCDAIAVYRADPRDGSAPVSGSDLRDEVFRYDGSEPAWFAGILGDQLFVDIGTAPAGRTVVIYDIRTGRQLYRDEYMREVTIRSRQMQYWQATTRAVTRRNCPNAKAWEESGWGPVITEQIVVDLRTLRRRRTGRLGCDFYN